MPAAATTTPLAPNKTDIGGTTKAKDNVMPAPTAGGGMDANARKQAKADKKAKKDAKKMDSSSSSMNDGNRASATSQSPSK